ncbi:hypothetical protein CORC01_08907 [Colletotrichum orchidophilum]|uniref:Uncharacterized protein n=1 Tax=Colletotrichum orchidophilum TaxID=1209926 RepID=A0A1G4B332_9PEZI|nr:uncharacterized protein CORC01_08907 [Colletotrichum orchidophilum]OHE95766.1 hypothetical protein CORC01_08907 [Colletotrichum orchidophilum]
MGFHSTCALLLVSSLPTFEKSVSAIRRQRACPGYLELSISLLL